MVHYMQWSMSMKEKAVYSIPKYRMFNTKISEVIKDRIINRFEIKLLYIERNATPHYLEDIWIGTTLGLLICERE